MNGLAGDPDLFGDLGEGKVFLAMKGNNLTLFLRQHPAVKGGKESKIHLAPEIFPFHREPLQVSSVQT